MSTSESKSHPGKLAKLFLDFLNDRLFEGKFVHLDDYRESITRSVEILCAMHTGGDNVGFDDLFECVKETLGFLSILPDGRCSRNSCLGPKPTMPHGITNELINICDPALIDKSWITLDPGHLHYAFNFHATATAPRMLRALRIIASSWQNSAEDISDASGGSSEGDYAVSIPLLAQRIHNSLDPFLTNDGRRVFAKAQLAGLSAWLEKLCRAYCIAPQAWPKSPPFREGWEMVMEALNWTQDNLFDRVKFARLHYDSRQEHGWIPPIPGIELTYDAGRVDMLLKGLRLMASFTKHIPPKVELSLNGQQQIVETKCKVRRTTKEEANAKAKSLLMKDKAFANKGCREWANEIGCSIGLISKLSIWKATQELKKKKSMASSKVVSLTTKLESVMGTGGKDAVLNELIREQRQDEIQDLSGRDVRRIRHL